MKRATTILGRALWTNAGILLFCVALQFWQFLTGAPLTTRTAVTVVLLCMICRSFGAIQEGRGRVVPEPANSELDRVFVDDASAVLERSKLTGYDAVRSFTPYLGKWMTISGRHEGITGEGWHSSVSFVDRWQTHKSPICDAARRLRSGQRITAVCQIQHRYFTFTPENCELVRAEPIRYAERSTVSVAS